MSFAAIAIAGTVASVGMGTAQMISANKGRRRAELEAKAQNSPIYKPSKSIQSQYQEAKNRYMESPYQSQEYLQGMKNINQASAEGIFGAQRLRGGIGGMSKISGTKANALQNLAIGVGSRKDQRFRDLGQASQAMAGEEKMEFDINKQTPYNRDLQLAQWKAQSAADAEQAGLSTIGTGLSNLATFAAYQGMGAKGASSNAANTPLTSKAGFDSFMAKRGDAPMAPKSYLAPKDPFLGQSTGNYYNYRPIKFSKL